MAAKLCILSYFLDFSLGEISNFESRLFVTIPSRHQDAISICFEMNSTYKRDTGRIYYIINHSCDDVSQSDKKHVIARKSYCDKDSLYVDLIPQVQQAVLKHVDDFKKKASIVLKEKFASQDYPSTLNDYGFRIDRYGQEVVRAIEQMHDNTFLTCGHYMNIKEECLPEFKELNAYLHKLMLSRKLNMQLPIENSDAGQKPKHKI